MEPDLDTLSAIANVDRQATLLVRERDKQLLLVPAAEEECRAARGARDAAKEVFEASRDEERRLNREVHAFTGRKAAAERALDLGTGSAAAAIRQLDQCTAAIDDLETQLLELLEDQDELGETLAAAERALGQCEARLTEVGASSDARLEELEGQLAALDAEREVHLAQLPVEEQKRYRLVIDHKGSAFTRIDGGACKRCYTVLGPQRELEVKRGRVITCPRCARWIVPG